MRAITLEDSLTLSARATGVATGPHGRARPGKEVTRAITLEDNLTLAAWVMGLGFEGVVILRSNRV